MNTKTKKTVCELLSNAPMIAKGMPPNIKGSGPKTGATTNFCRHTTPMMIYFDYRLLSLLGDIIPISDMKNKMADFIRESPGYGKRGGSDYGMLMANRIYNDLRKEGLIVEF